MRRSGPFLCLAGIACGRVVAPGSAPLPDAGAVVFVPAPAADDAGPTITRPPERDLAVVAERLRFEAPKKTRVLYTWTTQEQLDILQKGGPVLQRSFSPGKGFASFDHALYERVTLEDPNAKLLWHEAFGKSRFAWSNAFGAVSAIGSESYGDVLLRITLKPEAQFYDFNLHREYGPITSPANKNPALVGSVQFTTNIYREYVLPNESMIDRVEAFTPSLKADLEEQLELVRSFQNSDKPTPAHVLSEFFPHRQVLITPEILAKVASVLEAVSKSQSTAFERRVAASFALGNPRPSLAAMCKKLGVIQGKTLMSTFGARTFFESKCVPLAKATCFSAGSSVRDHTHCAVLPTFFE